MNSYLPSVKREFASLKNLGEKAIGQIDEKGLVWKYNEESNSIAVIVQHLRGNMRSRWTDFFTTDGEKEWRFRDTEFEDKEFTSQDIFNLWEEGWQVLFDALNSILEKDLESTVYIRNEPHSVIEAINRQLAHYASHIGQIIYIARMIKGKAWNSLSIPKGESNQFNQKKMGK